MKLKLLFLTIAIFAVFIGNCFASAEEVQVTVSELKIFPVMELRRVAVGDPEIADVTVLNDKELMLMAKKAGTTSLIIWDRLGQRSFNIVVLEKDLEKAAQRIRELLISTDVSGVKVKKEEDKIYAIGEVLTQHELDKVKDILAPFANAVNLVKLKERMPLVEIAVNVLEVGFDDEKDLGLDWSTQLPVRYSEPAHIEGKAPKLWRVFNWSRSAVDARLDFLIQDNKARTLSNPKLVAVSGKEASFLVGGEIPYITVETEGRTNVEWKEYGVNLRILPQVNAKNEINTRIKAEVSDIDTSTTVTYQGYEIPATKKRAAETELFLNDGDTVFIAGLIKNEDSRNVDRLPWLSKVPILGELFKSTEFTDKRTELVISLTPRILREPGESQYLNGEIIQEAKVRTSRRVPVYGEDSPPVVYYSHMVEDIIAGGVVYPQAARQARFEGTVKLDLLLLADGKLQEAKVTQSSGIDVLDEAALAAVIKQSYPPFPPQLTQDELRLTVPVVFKSYVKKE